jgi:hypothetical protein
MVKKIGKYDIPFDADGNQMHYAEHGWDGTYNQSGSCNHVAKYTMQPNDPFPDTLTFKGYQRGRSAAYFHFERENGKGVCVFLKEMEAMIPLMVHGKITGTFQFIKRGQNYGCAIAP